MEEVELLHRTLDDPKGRLIARFRLEGGQVVATGDEHVVAGMREAGIHFSGKKYTFQDGEEFLKALVGKHFQSTYRTTRIVS